MKHSGTRTLETKRLILRPFNLNDVDIAYKNWTSDDKVTKFLRWPTHSSRSVTEEIIKEWVDNYKNLDYYNWAIVLKETGEPIGSISCVDMNDKLNIVHIGYCIGSRWWHKGIMSEAFKEIIKYLFEVVDVNRIESQHDPNNPHSGDVMKKCGLIYEGTHRQADFSNRGIVDASMYAILKSDWLNAHK